jgi:hypothetical protein
MESHVLKTRLFIILAVLLTINSFHGAAQVWSSPITSPNVPGIRFEWRRLTNWEMRNLTLIEWRFTNVSDSVITCVYRVRSDSGEERIGKIILKPHTQNLSGWYFTGDKIERLELTEVTFQALLRRSPQ